MKKTLLIQLISHLTYLALLLILIATPQTTRAQDLVQLDKLLAADGVAENRFGTSVSLDGNRALVGAVQEETDRPGTAYVFERDVSGNWIQVAKLVADDGGQENQFGTSVSLSGDLALVGATGGSNEGALSGSAYVFERGESGNWTQVAKLVAEDGAEFDLFGSSVSLRGNRALIGAHRDDGTGSAYVFERDGVGQWMQTAKLVAEDGASGSQFGRSVSLSGDRALIGAFEDDAPGNDSGSAYIFERGVDGNWTQVAKLIADDGALFDRFGYSVSLSGDVALIGSRGNDEGGENSGAAYIFERDGVSNWTQMQKLTADDAQAGDLFGWSVSLSGGLALVGAIRDDDQGDDAGSAYLFERDGAGNWAQKQKLTANDGAGGERFGYSVSLSEDQALVGAVEDNDQGDESGSAYVFGVPCPDITVSTTGETSVVLGYGSNCTDLSATASGGTGPYSYTWSGSSETGKTITVCPEETTTYTVTATDGNGCVGSRDVTIEVQDVNCGNRQQNTTICYYGVTQCVPEKIAKRYLRLGATLGSCGSSAARIGVAEAGEVPSGDASLQLSLKAYPNPVRDAVTVKVLSPAAGRGTFEVLDMTGRARQTRTKYLQEGRNEVEFRLGSLPSGVYLIRAVDALNREGTVRVSKQ